MLISIADAQGGLSVGTIGGLAYCKANGEWNAFNTIDSEISLWCR
ncbi:MAG: hypothetical protein VSS75_028610 [Candidatus Parabeggiatoa sp.]|nr:hypothetical protein [Candidatus Parabeggiatoa sp.]